MIAEEPYSEELFDELMPLFQRSWDESTQMKGPSCAFYGERDLKIEPHRQVYKYIADMGALMVLTVRDAGKLVGYLAATVHLALHHKHIMTANVDCAYLEPEYRGKHAGALVAFFEKAAKSRGAQMIGWPAHPDGALFKLLLAKGYVGDDIVMEKRLCA